MYLVDNWHDSVLRTGAIHRDDGANWDTPQIVLIDKALAAIMIMFFAPLLLLVVVAIKVLDPGPAIFRHRRIGRDGNSFYCLKFRTMVVDSERRLQELFDNDPSARIEWTLKQKLTVDPRITRLGRFLRKSSIDELPQLFNVLLGNMSLVGPRPIVDEEITRYGRYFAHYIRVRPGITGLWQISGRNDVSYRRRVAMDVMYAKHRNLSLNLTILTMTIPAVLLAKGSS